ncbi:chromatin modification- protein eaf6 [Coemansia erecta]|uniref:Chromatin modification-related protein EAF6 n=1 Tax=Coemansia erecta TaxID=147472 RepID=A0A9W7XY49_9FUNG|nr:chromatin modification- protein eaf6 [Coemansia erecta]
MSDSTPQETPNKTDPKSSAGPAAAASAADNGQEGGSTGTPKAAGATAAAAAAGTSAKSSSSTKANGKSGEAKVTKKMLKEAEQELYQLLLKKKQLDRNLIEMESTIYDFETSYFETPGQEGNIVHGFEGYLTSRHEQRRQHHFTEADRIFSQSSATFKKAQEAKIAQSLLDSDSDESVASMAQARPGVKRKNGGSTIKHRAGTPSRATPGPQKTTTTKKLKLSL